MKLSWIVLPFLSGLFAGCTHLQEATTSYLEVWVENAADVKVSSVAVGPRDQCSDFGILGSKGAKKVAVVPVQFVRDFPVLWEENSDGKERQTVVDLRQFEGVKNRAIVLRYKGAGQWEAGMGREIRTRTRE